SSGTGPVSWASLVPGRVLLLVPRGERPGRDAHPGLAGRDARVARDHRAAARQGAVAHGAGRDQDRATAHEGALADHRAVLLLAVVVRHDRAGADVRARAYRHVAEVREVLRLDVLAELCVLGLGEVAHLGARRQHRARAQVREGSDLAVLADAHARADDRAGQDARARADLDA